MENNQETTSSELTERQIRDTLKALSMDLFGSSSRYQKLRERIVPVTETVVAEDGSTTERQVFNNGIRLLTTKITSDLDLIAEMTDVKKRRDDYISSMAKKQAEAEAAKKVSEEASGSAV